MQSGGVRVQISVIIPVYNAADTLERCLDSILAQSFGDFQVIIVDDASTDGSLELAQRWVKQDARFVVIPAAHGGAGAARNAGLPFATGEYVVYMDADDYWVQEDLLQNLVDQIHREPADIYMYQMIKVTEEGTVLERYTKPPFTNADRVLPLGDVYQDLVRDGHTLTAAWNKCVRRGLMTEKGIAFRENTFGEDIDWVLQLFSQAQTICLMNIWAYAYTQHKTPTRSTRSDAHNDLVAIVMDWAERVDTGGMAHTASVAGVLAFEYGICMGRYHLLAREKKRIMVQNTHLLRYGMDRKTMLIRRFYNIFGYHLTCAAVRVYLFLRRIW